MLDLDAIEAVARGESALWPNWKGDALAMVAEIRRLRQFVRDSGTTCYPCETCGHARTTRECLWCERDRLRELCGEAANSIADADIKSSLVDRLRAASKGEA